MSWLKTVHIQSILKLLSPNQSTKEHEVSPLLCLNKNTDASFDRMAYIATENTNIPFKIYMNFQILIAGNV